MRTIIICLAFGLAAIFASFYAAAFEGYVYIGLFFGTWLRVVSLLSLAASTVLLVIAVARTIFRASDADQRASEQEHARIAGVARRQIEAD